MPRKKRIFIQGFPHLVRLQSNNVEALFREPVDYHHFQEILDKALLHYKVKIFSYSLSPQQVFLLIEAEKQQAMVRFMQYIGRCYVPWFNQRYQRRGHLWESRYHSSPIAPDSYFLLVKKYIERVCKQQQGVGSFGQQPQRRVSTHPCWQALGATDASQASSYLNFFNSPMVPAITHRIQTAIEQNCMLAPTDLRRLLEEKHACSLSPRQTGRPRKIESQSTEHWCWIQDKISDLLRRYCYQLTQISLIEHHSEGAQGNKKFSSEHASIGLAHQSIFINDGTVGCLNTVAHNANLQTQSKLWYTSTTFNRYLSAEDNWHSYSQLNAEAFGYSGIGIELEQLALQYRLFCAIQLENHVELKINTPGNRHELVAYRQALNDYFRPYTALLSSAQLAHLTTAPEKLLDSDDILIKRLLADAPRLWDRLSESSKQRFTTLCQGLSRLGIPFTHDKCLAPVNDYTDLVAEWYGHWFSSTTLLCRGGRYDQFASHYVQRPLTACGFSLMVEPIVELVQQTRQYGPPRSALDMILIPQQPRFHPQALTLSQRLRQAFPQLSIANDFSGLKSTLCQRNAQRQGTHFIVLVGDVDEDLTLIDTVHPQRIEINREQLHALISDLLLW